MPLFCGVELQQRAEDCSTSLGGPSTRDMSPYKETGLISGQHQLAHSHTSTSQANMAQLLSFEFGSSANAPQKPASVEIAEYGRIRFGRIPLNKLNIFVGKNNTGKSYTAYMIWAIWSSYLGLAPNSRYAVSAPKWFRDRFSKLNAGKTKSFKVSGEEVADSYNRWLGQKKERSSQRLAVERRGVHRKITVRFSWGNLGL